MGLLRLGFITRFISNTVIVGFLSGVAATIVLSQLGELMGYHSSEMGVLPRVYDLFTLLDEIEVNALLVGAVTIITMLVLLRTRMVMLSIILALDVSTLETLVFGLSMGLLS